MPRSGNPKLLSLAEASARRDRLDRQGKTFVLTNGVFDLLHPGHRYYLRRAARLGDEVYVALNSNQSVKALKGRERPIEGERLRARKLARLPEVKGILIFRQKRLTRQISRLRPHVYAKAGDYTRETLDRAELAALDKVGAKIRFVPFLPGHSTTRLIAQMKAGN